MGEQEARAAKLWAASLAIGLVGQALFAWTGFGLNVAIFSMILFAVVAIGFRNELQKVRRESIYWSFGAVLGAIGVALNDSAILQALNLGVVFASLGMVAYASQQSIGDGTMTRSAVALVGWFGLWCEGAVHLAQTKLTSRQMSEESRERLRAIFRGLVLAVPLLFVFGGLFFAADPVFQRMATSWIQLDMNDLIVRGFLFGGLTIFGAGIFGAIQGRSVFAISRPPSTGGLKIGSTEFGVLFGLLCTLFLAFLVVQARYLFGGNDLVLATEGLTYAQYARQGFFELMTVAGIAIPTLLLFLGFCNPSERARPWINGLSVAFLGQVAALLLSAARRMSLYVDAHGLTELRYYTSATMAWLAVVIVGLIVFVVRNRSGRAGSWIVGTAMAAILITTVSNPDERIAEVNLARHSSERPVDLETLLDLGSGATRPLLNALDRLEPDAQTFVRERLADRYRKQDDYREWTLVHSQAKDDFLAANRTSSK